MLATLRHENQQLRVEQAEMMDAMKFQRASLEAKVRDLQQELEQQLFRTPESGGTVKRHLEMTTGEQEKEIDLDKERKRLYELTPMQQFEQLQSLSWAWQTWSTRTWTTRALKVSARAESIRSW